MICWPLLSYVDPNVMVQMGAPPPPLPDPSTHRKDVRIEDDPVVKQMSWLERDTYVCSKRWYQEDLTQDIPPAHRSTILQQPTHHALPAAYELWVRLAREASERAMRWDEDEFQMRRRRAAILCEIQFEQVYKWLLENALDELHRQNELIEMSKMATRQDDEVENRILDDEDLEDMIDQEEDNDMV